MRSNTMGVASLVGWWEGEGGFSRACSPARCREKTVPCRAPGTRDVGAQT